LKLHTFEIPDGTQSGRLGAWLARMLPDVPAYAIREAFKKRDVKVDGKRLGEDAPLLPGSRVDIYLPDTSAKQRSIPILYQDERVLVVFKPAGISCEPDGKGGLPLPKLLAVQNPGLREPIPCHRLDNPTSGILVLAKTQHAWEVLTAAFAARQIHKEYTCLVKGCPEPREASCKAFLLKDAQNARVRVFSHPVPDGKTILTDYRVLREGESSLVQVTLHTGRTHQIRAHMAYLGYPLLGDDLYGDRAWNRAMHAKRLCLCATALRFALEGDMSDLNRLTLSVPADFEGGSL